MSIMIILYININILIFLPWITVGYRHNLNPHRYKNQLVTFTSFPLKCIYNWKLYHWKSNLLAKLLPVLLELFPLIFSFAFKFPLTLSHT